AGGRPDLRAHAAIAARHRAARGAVDHLRRRHHPDRVLPAARHRAGVRRSRPPSPAPGAPPGWNSPVSEPGKSGADVALEVRDLAVHIGGLVALGGISFQVPFGAIVSLIGPNGAGKTTAFNVITGFMRPTDGQVFFRGRDLARMTPERIAALGMVRTFQRTSLFAACTVFENVLTALHLRGRTGLLGALLRLPAMRREEATLHAEAREILDFVGLGGRADEIAGNLAYGEQR